MVAHEGEAPAASRTWWFMAGVGAAVVLALALVWLASRDTRDATSSAAGGMTQAVGGGSVTVKVTWDGANGPVFQVALDTHAVDLDTYDLRQLATLSVDGGPALQPVAWDAPFGGHHRAGTLTFPTTTASGQAVLGPGAHTLELIIRDVAGVPERVFTWTAAAATQ